MKIRVTCGTTLFTLFALVTPALAAKVAICHVPPGNPANSHTISVSQNAVQAHLNHGDFLGECCPCWEASELQSVTAENQLDPGFFSCSTSFFGSTGAVIQNIPGSTPDEEGGFGVATDGETGACFTRDLPPLFLAITLQQAEGCVQAIRSRCEAIGTPIP